MAKRPAWTVGEVFAFPGDHDGWGACQVVRAGANGEVEVVVLDHLSDAPPTLSDVCLIPLRQSRFGANGALQRIHVIDALPDDFVRLGRADAVVPEAPHSNVWAFLTSRRNDVWEERRWAQIPADVRDAYNTASVHDRVEICVDGLPHPLPLRQSWLHLDLTRGAPAQGTLAPRDPARFDPSVLDALPCLTELRVTGAAPWLPAWLARRPVLRTLRWQRPDAAALDLRASHLDLLALTAPDLRALALPDALEDLHLLADPAETLDVTTKDRGRALRVELAIWRTEALRAVRGVEAARGLVVRGFTTLDLASLSPYTRCRELSLAGAPGRLQGGSGLGALTALQILHLRGCVALDAAEMPPLSSWAQLQEVRAWGCHARDMAALKSRWGHDPRVHLRAPINDDDVFATTGHPVLRWPDDTRRGVVTRAYALTAKKLCLPSLTAVVAQKSLASFVAGVRRAVTATGPLTDGERADLAVCWAQLVARARARCPTLDVRGTRVAW
jgi:hypothetical protein